MIKALTPAEKVLQSLGITEPGEIDLEALAWMQGVKVKFRPLDGCEARIVGKGDTAIITVNSRSTHGRQRFSLAHELGHWEYHRGQIMVCRSDEIGSFSQKASTAEKRADSYAANLLMPNYMFRPAIRTFRHLDFEALLRISDIFGVSITAAAIRCIETGDYPAVLVCHNHKGRCWFNRSPLVPDRWFPRTELQPGSSAMDILYAEKASRQLSRLSSISAEAWFDRHDAHRYEILEQSLRIGASDILSLLILEDDEMLEE
jgi:Zn-dependent peptidase ImmA (M78 family)